MDMFFIASQGPDGGLDCSYKGGEPGFVKVVDDHTIAFPNSDGNGQYTDATGGAAVGAAFQSTQPDGHTGEYPLFMPYAELELPPGEHPILVTVIIHEAAGNSAVVMRFSASNP